MCYRALCARIIDNPQAPSICLRVKVVIAPCLRSELALTLSKTSATSSQALEKDGALHGRYKGIDPFDGIDADGSKWHTFKDQLTAATDCGSARTKAIVYGNQAAITAANAAVEAGVMFSDLQSRDPTAYDKLWDKDYC